MTGNVYIKSFPNGLKVELNNTCTFEEILDEVKIKFSESKNFFKGSKIAVSFEGRELTSLEEKMIINTMEAFSDMTVLYVIGKDGESSLNYAKVVQKKNFVETDEQAFGKIYRGNLRKGERLESETGILIAGDVEPGARVIAKGNIVILGGLYGMAHIDVKDNFERYFVFASDISCEKIKIGDFRYYTKEKAKWVIKPKMQPKIAYYKNMQVTVEPVSNELLMKLNKELEKEENV